MSLGVEGGSVVRVQEVRDKGMWVSEGLSGVLVLLQHELELELDRLQDRLRDLELELDRSRQRELEARHDVERHKLYPSASPRSAPTTPVRSCCFSLSLSLSLSPSVSCSLSPSLSLPLSLSPSLSFSLSLSGCQYMVSFNCISSGTDASSVYLHTFQNVSAAFSRSCSSM